MNKTKRLKPHEIKHKLYEMEEVHLKGKALSPPISPKNKQEVKMIKPRRSVQPRKLDENVPGDRKLMESRKKRIKEFNQFTRDLSNSAFCAYYGKPAFEAYGRCSSNTHLKTHNVMPHRGGNHPETRQTYDGALANGLKNKVEDHLPRRPL
jgi:hypothetical protein